MTTIYCFSTTGNSLYVAKELANGLDAQVISMTSHIEECSDSVIGFVFPTYFLGLPKTVESFITRLKITHPTPYIFAVTTYGGSSIGLSYYLKKILSAKNIKLNYYSAVRSVENYTPSPFLNVDNFNIIHKHTDKKIQTIRKRVLERTCSCHDIHTPLTSIMQFKDSKKMKLNYDKNFIVTNCKSCGLCEQICPRSNIIIKSGHPVFQGNCEQCMACLHACPSHSIQLDFSRKKKQYLNPHINRSEIINLLHPKA